MAGITNHAFDRWVERGFTLDEIASVMAADPVGRKAAGLNRWMHEGNNIRIIVSREHRAVITIMRTP